MPDSDVILHVLLSRGHHTAGVPISWPSEPRCVHHLAVVRRRTHPPRGGMPAPLV